MDPTDDPYLLGLGSFRYTSHVIQRVFGNICNPIYLSEQSIIQSELIRRYLKNFRFLSG